MATNALNIGVELFTIFGKDLRISATTGFDKHYDHHQKCLLVVMLLEAMSKKPVDMYVVEEDETNITVRCAGYGLKDEVLDEETIIIREDKLFPIRKFWFKVDDYGKFYLGTILFPEEY